MLRTLECQEIVDGLMPCLKELDLGLSLPKVACHPICPAQDTHTQVLLHAIAIPLAVLNTAITFDWRICQYFSQEEVYCRTSKVNIEDDMCAKLGNINSRCNEAVFLETTRI